LADGTGSSGAQKVGHAQPDDHHERHDLRPHGGRPRCARRNINFTKIKRSCREHVNSTAANIITIGAAASSAWEAWTTVAGSTGVARPRRHRGFRHDPLAGFTVDATHKNLKLIAQSGTASGEDRRSSARAANAVERDDNYIREAERTIGQRVQAAEHLSARARCARTSASRRARSASETTKRASA
jgi:hypothetical protein